MKCATHDNIRCPRAAKQDLLPVFRYLLKYVSTNSRRPPAEVKIVVESSVELSPCSLFNLSKVALRLSSFEADRGPGFVQIEET